MKTTFAVTALSTKLIMLLCVSCMGLFGVIQDSFAENLNPCHQEIVQEDKTKAPCEICETALTAWEEDAVATPKVVLSQITELEFTVEANLPTFQSEIKPFKGIYLAYNPPPKALLKAVTPITKTIVLLS